MPLTHKQVVLQPPVNSSSGSRSAVQQRCSTTLPSAVALTESILATQSAEQLLQLVLGYEDQQGQQQQGPQSQQQQQRRNGQGRQGQAQQRQAPPQPRQQLNAIHLTAAATRLASFSSVPGALTSMECSALLPRFLALVSSERTTRLLDARGVANMLWALAKVSTSSGHAAVNGSGDTCSGCRAAALRIAPCIPLHCAEFSAQHVSNMLWALAVLLLPEAAAEAAAINGAAAKGTEGRAASGTAPSSDSAPHSNGKPRVLAAAPLAPGGQGRQQGRLDQVLVLLQDLALERMPQASPQAMANLLWASAKLGLAPAPAWLSAFYSLSLPQLPSWSGQAVSNVLWAMVQLQLRPDNAWLHRLFGCTLQRLTSFSTRDLANIAWALASLGVSPPRSWVHALLAASQQRLQRQNQLAGQELSTLMWGLASLAPEPSANSGVQRDTLADARRAVAQAGAQHMLQCCSTLSVQSFSNTSWALARLGFVPTAPWLQAWCSSAGALLQCGNAQALSNCMWALAMWQHQGTQLGQQQEQPQRPSQGSLQAAPAGHKGSSLSAMQWRAAAAQHLAAVAERDELGELAAALTVALSATNYSVPILGAVAAGSSSSSAANGIALGAQARPGTLIAQSLGGAGSAGQPAQRPQPDALLLAAHAHMRRHTLRYSPRQLVLGLWALVHARTALDASWLNGQVVPFLDRHSQQLDDRELAKYTWVKAQLGLPLLSHLVQHSTPSEAAAGSRAAAVEQLPAERLAAAGSLQPAGPANAECGACNSAGNGQVAGDAAGAGGLTSGRLAGDTGVQRLSVVGGAPAASNAAASSTGAQGAAKPLELALEEGASPPLPNLNPAPQQQQQQRAEVRAGQGLAQQVELRLGPEALTATVHALGRAPWLLRTSPALAAALVRRVPELAGSLNPRNLSICLWAVARLGFRPDEVWGARMWRALRSNLPHMCGGELSVCVWAVASMRMAPDDGAAAGVLHAALRLQPGCSSRDAVRLLHAASAWRTALPHAWWRAALASGSGPLRPGVLAAATGSRELVMALLHTGRLGCPLSARTVGLWSASAARHAVSLLPSLTATQLVSLVEAAALLRHRLQRRRRHEHRLQLRARRRGGRAGHGGSSGTISSRSSSSLRVCVRRPADGADGKQGRRALVQRRRVPRLPVKRGAPDVALHALMRAALREVERRGLSQLRSTTDDARLLRALVLHRRLTGWISRQELDSLTTAFFLATRARLASAPAPHCLQALWWLAALNILPDEAWMRACCQRLAELLRGMPPAHLSRVLLSLLQAGHRPSKEWIREYLAVVVHRLPQLSQQQVCSVTATLARVDRSLHARWCARIGVVYGA